MQCHTDSRIGVTPNGSSVALIGHPNVGKSVLFHRLTGQHVAVANYPGTTVDVSRGFARSLSETTMVDTPGVVTFPPHTEDEQVTERVLLQEPLKTILQVGDAKNIRRILTLTIQLAEFGLPLVLAMNMMDEADTRGMKVNYPLLSTKLNLPIIPTIGIQGQGIEDLTTALKLAYLSKFRLDYPLTIEAAVADICTLLPETPVAARAIALLWLCGDEVIETWLLGQSDEPTFQKLITCRNRLQFSLAEPISVLIQQTRQAFVEEVASSVILETGEDWNGLSVGLARLTTHPAWGLMILVLVMLGLYWFVGVFGAGILVDLLEVRLFGEIINPLITNSVNRLIPIPLLADILVGEYGLWTMGMTYALALILPIVTTFFFAFGILEDSGYLPRLAALSNRLFRTLGLNGKAVLPMVLGLGCVTMATLTTRVLESRRDRLLVTLLLALAVPCSAQLGVVMGMLAGISFTASLIWGGVVFVVLIVVGWLAARLVQGDRTPLLVELPPLRLPLFSNVILKTAARLEWYLKEVVPLFLIGTFIMFLLDWTGVLAWLSQAGEPLVTGWLGLPPEASSSFIMGFLRRDFGAVGLFIMESQGLLTPFQVVVAMVTITLFIPCFASVLMIAKERGWRIAAGMIVLIFPLAFLVGGILYRVLLSIEWIL